MTEYEELLGFALQENRPVVCFINTSVSVHTRVPERNLTREI